MEEHELKEIARQLRRPDGDFGKKVGEMMNESNFFMNQESIASLNLKQADQVLEIGPGNGMFVNKILSVDDNIKYYGVDFSELMIEEAKRNNKRWIEEGRAEFHLTSAEKLPFDDKMFDKIFTVNTIYFWDNPAITLGEIKRVLSPGGQFHLVFRPKSAMTQLPFTKFGFRMYDLDEACSLLRDNGFQILEKFEKQEPGLENDEQWAVDEYKGTISIIIAGN